MLTEILLGCDGKKPQSIDFEAIFDYRGKKNFKKMKSLQAVADTSSMSLSYLGELFPGLQVLRLDNSVIDNIRDISTQLNLLRVLSLEHCSLTSLDGICAVCPRIEELYVGFNQVGDVSELLGLNSLRVLNIESNLIPRVGDVELLKCCRKLRALFLRGNGAEEEPEYRAEVKRLLPQLRCLDGVRFDGPEEAEPAPPPPADAEPAPPPEPELPKTAPLFGRPAGAAPPPAGDRPTTAVRSAVVKPKIARPVVKTWYNAGSIRL
jgi:hypothetical protein